MKDTRWLRLVKKLKEEGNFNIRPIQCRFRKIDPQKLKDYAAEHNR